MNANEAFKLTKQSWQDNNIGYLEHIKGYKEKIIAAAKQGRANCDICLVPKDNPALIDSVGSFFENLGYYVNIFIVEDKTKFIINLNWKNEPFMSRPYKESLVHY